MESHLRTRRFLRQNRLVSSVLRYGYLPLALVVLFFCGGAGWRISSAFAQSHCSNSSSTSCASNLATHNTQAHQPRKGASNRFPRGSCTWWANQRYHQLHAIYVPWLSQSNAWQWTARARQFFWHVSNRPSPGAIIDLQPWVQGAYGLGHVAVVEKVLKNGHVIASNMSWGRFPWRVVNVEFKPGPGVTFISF